MHQEQNLQGSMPNSIFSPKDIFKLFGKKEIPDENLVQKISYGNNHLCCFSFDSTYKLLKLIRSFSGDFTFVFMYNPETNEIVLLDNPYISLEPISILSNSKTSKCYSQKRRLLNLETLIKSMKEDFKSIFIGSGYNISSHCLWNETNYSLDKILLTVKLA
jgi:hypothetical protein